MEHTDKQKACDVTDDGEQESFGDIDGGGCGGHKYFGIKSYLHNFYENVSTRNDIDDFDDDCSITHSKDEIRRRRRRSSTIWMAAIIAGVTSMLCGSLLLLVGFTFPKMKIDIGYQEEMRIIDKSAYDFNIHLDQIKVIGLCMFTIGGVLVASALLLPGLLPSASSDADDTSGGHFKLQIDDDCDSDGASKNLIPITEELREVQPRKESTTVITNAGLKRIE